MNTLAIMLSRIITFNEILIELNIFIFIAKGEIYTMTR